jgi:hypothetical protein
LQEVSGLKNPLNGDKINLRGRKKWRRKGAGMQKRGSGRFGKYGDLKRKEKIRQTRLLKHEATAKLVAGQTPGVNKKRKAEDDKR